MRITAVCAALAMMGLSAGAIAQTGRTAPVRGATPAPLAHAINTKGNSAQNGRMAINTKGTGCSNGRTASADHAINTKGTGTAGRAAADHAINTKGSGATSNGRMTAPTDPATPCEVAPETSTPRS